MRFRKDAQLDSSQVEDYRGGGGNRGRPGGMPMTLGGGGLAQPTVVSERRAASTAAVARCRFVSEALPR
jgi:hypothetical protein